MIMKIEELDLFINQQKSLGNKQLPKEFMSRLQIELPMLKGQLKSIYPELSNLKEFIVDLIHSLYESYQERPQDLKSLDKKRLNDPSWFLSQNMVGGVCYVDLYAENFDGIRQQIPYFKSLGLTYLHFMPLFKAPDKENDGGYAVSSYRETNPTLGNIEGLRLLAKELRKAGISLVLDFIFNHTSNEHEWALKCLSGDTEYQDFYLIFPDRKIPDEYEKHTREIFPEEHAGQFTQLPDGRWIWTTFHQYQWDLNYANPKVFQAMAREMLFIVNQGAEILRMDAVAFLWKKMGTSCENLPEVHTIIQAFNTITKIVAPSVIFKSEAIVHPDEVIQYISSRECQISYNPLQMALLWSTLATREVNLLNHALSNRHLLSDKCSWVNYVRSHDDIGWTFSDEDAAGFHINGLMHRKFLNQFYLGDFPGSFAEGVAFQENLKNGDCRICGTTASLAGLGRNDPFAVERILAMYNIVMSSGGIPLIYLGDEFGILNDLSYLDFPEKASDSRWVHRLKNNPNNLTRVKNDPNRAKLFAGIKQLINLRKQTKALAGGCLLTIDTGNPSVLAYMRESLGDRLFVFANFSEKTQEIMVRNVILQNRKLHNLINDSTVEIKVTYTLQPYEFSWLVL